MLDGKTTGALAACCVLAACGTARYVEPPEPGAATLVIENGSGDPMEAATFADQEKCSGMRALHEGIRDGGPHVVRVPGGAPFTLWTRTFRMSSTRGEAIPRITGGGVCSGSVTFEPRPGRRYVVHFQMHPDKEGFARTSGLCYVRIADEVRNWDGSARRTPVPFRWRKESACD